MIYNSYTCTLCHCIAMLMGLPRTAIVLLKWSRTLSFLNTCCWPALPGVGGGHLLEAWSLLSPVITCSSFWPNNGHPPPPLPGYFLLSQVSTHVIIFVSPAWMRGNLILVVLEHSASLIFACFSLCRASRNKACHLLGCMVVTTFRAVST